MDVLGREGKTVELLSAQFGPRLERPQHRRQNEGYRNAAQRAARCHVIDLVSKGSALPELQ
jgi:hypothetical protein